MSTRDNRLRDESVRCRKKTLARYLLFHLASPALASARDVDSTLIVRLVMFTVPSETRSVSQKSVKFLMSTPFHFHTPKSSKEFVANAMDRDDVLGLCRVLFDLLTQAGDVVVYRARERKIVITPDLV